MKDFTRSYCSDAGGFTICTSRDESKDGAAPTAKLPANHFPLSKHSPWITPGLRITEHNPDTTRVGAPVKGKSALQLLNEMQSENLPCRVLE